METGTLKTAAVYLTQVKQKGVSWKHEVFGSEEFQGKTSLQRKTKFKIKKKKTVHLWIRKIHF